MNTILNRLLKKSGFFMAVILGLYLSSSTSYAGWHELSQDDRNGRMLSQAYNELGSYGGQCKPWGSHIANVASTAAGGPKIPVSLPLTYPNADGWSWYPDSDGNSKTVSYGTLPPSGMMPGMFVQMRIRYANGTYGPHTAIVFTNWTGAQQLCFIESNYSGDGRVRTRCVSYANFLSSIEGYPNNPHYTVYVIQ